MIHSVLASGLLMTSFFVSPQLAQTSPVNAIRIYETASEDLEQIRLQQEERVNSQNEVRREVKVSNQEELRNRIQELNNEKLSQRLLQFADRFEDINDKWVEHWSNVLERLSEVLTKIEVKADELAEEGEDVSMVFSSIDHARTAIATAQDAVDALASKEYLFEVDNEETVGQNVREQIQLFKDDAAQAREEVFEAKKAVQSAFQELRKVFSDNSLDANDE